MKRVYAECQQTSGQFHGFAYHRIMRLRSPFSAYVQALIFCASYVSVESRKNKKNKTKLDLSFCHNKNKVSGIGEYKNTSLVEIYKATIPRSNAYSKHFTCTSGLDRPKGQEKVTNIPIFVKYVKPFHMMYRLSK